MNRVTASVRSSHLLRWLGMFAASFGAAGCSDARHVAAIDAGAGSDASSAFPASALVLTFSPEAIEPVAEPGLDTMGYLRVQVFDTPTPTAGETLPLYDEILPHGAEAGAEISVFELPTVTARLPAELGTAYVRAVFYDNSPRARYRVNAIDWGTWVGGSDLEKGFRLSPALTAVPLSTGESTHHDVPLRALRRVSVTVTTSATPLGDGEGALSVGFSHDEELPPRVTIFGYGIDPCVDLNQGPHVIDVQVVGSGKFFVSGFFDDLGIQTPGQVPPGTLLSARDPDVVTGSATLDAYTLEPTQYSGALSIDLGFVVPLPGDAGVPGPNSCRDLGFVADRDR